MKQLTCMIAAATLLFAACKKQTSPAPMATPAAEHVTESDFDGSKAITSLKMKKSGEGLEFDYDLTIKEVTEGTYETAIKIHGLKLNGTKADAANKIPVFAIVLAVNNTKGSKEAPLSVTLTVKDVKDLSEGKVISFPTFTYKGNLAYELIDVRAIISVDPASVKVYNKSTFSFGSVYFELLDTKTDLGKVSWEIAEGISGAASAMGKVEGHEKAATTTYTNFALYYNGTKGSEKCDVVESNTIFVLPMGHTTVQDPKIAKITVEEEKGVYGYVTITISGDPAKTINKLVYRPFAEPGKPDAGPVMTFLPTHYNMIQGVQRFESTKTWEEVFGKTTASVSTLIRRGREMGVPSFTD